MVVRLSRLFDDYELTKTSRRGYYFDVEVDREIDAGHRLANRFPEMLEIHFVNSHSPELSYCVQSYD